MIDYDGIDRWEPYEVAKAREKYKHRKETLFMAIQWQFGVQGILDMDKEYIKKFIEDFNKHYDEKDSSGKEKVQE